MLKLKENFGSGSVDRSAYAALLPFMPDATCSWGAKLSTIEINGRSAACIRMSYDYMDDLMAGLEAQGFEEADIDHADPRVDARSPTADFYSRGELLVSVDVISKNALEDADVIFVIEQS